MDFSRFCLWKTFLFFFCLMVYNFSMNYVDYVIESFWQFQASFVAVLVPIIVFRFVMSIINNRFRS